MLIKHRKGWELPESKATPEQVFRDRRRLLAGLGLGGIALGGLAFAAGEKFPSAAAAEPPDPSAGLYPVKRNERYKLDRAVTKEEYATRYNNFYEYGTSKRIWQDAQELKIRPWTVAIDGMVEKPITVDFDTLLRAMPLEERLYRHRCVEAWSMAVPWSGFPLKALVDYARPQASATYLKMQTFDDPKMAPGENDFTYPWPYTEGLTMAEANNELAFVATGLYGKPMPKQNGAPLRLVTPWKYGFKSVKSIVRFTFTDKRPKTLWAEVGPNEYGFWANVN
ncbi:MAG TPA: protein-methionine-sulfoxide reductase catalytic subunit MsrP, partial [Candidatus Sulfotelmatobacter sp.]|nr:protein-methionine-sulfoxide reductase catalytic subunit MsrP [Candidatus Sulfotelmatobacter sp.]